MTIRPRSIRDPYLPEAPWAYPDPLVVFFAGVAGSFLGFILSSLLGLDGLAVLAVALLFQGAASLGVMAWLSAGRGSGDWARDFGLVIRPQHVWGVVVGLLLQLVVALIVAPLIELFGPEDPPQQSIADVAEELSGGVETLVFLSLVVLVAPLVEEIVFRGMLLSRMRRSMGAWPAILLSGAVFAAVHLIDPNAVFAVPGLFLIGSALAWMALRTGELSLPIFVHAGVNLSGALLLFYQDELAEAVESVESVIVLL